MAKRSGKKRAAVQQAAPENPRAKKANPLSAILRALLIAAAVLWIYWPALHGDWLWDDDVLVAQNAIVQSPDGLAKIWLQPDSLIDYFPITVTVEWIEWHLWGNQPLGFHVVCLALHFISALLVWRLLAKFNLRWAWLGGLIFAIHPVVVESVAWIAELKNTLSLPPFLLAMIFWIDFEEQRRTRDYAAALALFIVAMLCKTTMVMFPLVILLYAWWKRGRIGLPDLSRSAPFFAVSLLLGLVTVFFLHNQPHHQDVGRMGGLLSRIACAGLSIAFYFSKCLLPVGLVPVYPRWIVDPPSLAQFLPWPILGGILWFLWTKRNGWGRHALLGFGFFLVLLLPFCGLVAGSYMRFSWVMDHLLYIPLIGLVGLAVAGIETFAQRTSPALRPVAFVFLAAMLVLFAAGSRSYAKIFVDRQTYWTYTAQQNPGAWMAHNNLGSELLKSDRFTEALQQFDLAAQGWPDYFEAFSNRGQLRLLMGDPAGARTDLDRAISLEPESEPPYISRGVLNLSQGDLPAALADLKHYRQLAPQNPQADYALLWIWIVRAQQGNKAQADQELAAALSSNWNAPPTSWTTQDARFLLGQISDKDYLAEATTPDQQCEAWYYSGIKRLIDGDKPGAIAAFQSCVATNKIDFLEYVLARAQLIVLRK